MSRYLMLFDIMDDDNNHLHVDFNKQIADNFSLDAQFTYFLRSAYLIDSELELREIGNAITKAFNKKLKEEKENNGSDGKIKLCIIHIDKCDCYCKNIPQCSKIDVQKSVAQLAGYCQQKDDD